MHIEIHPKVDGLAVERLMSFATVLADTEGDDVRALTEREAAWARRTVHLNGQTNAYEAAMRLLGDLRALKWHVRADGFGIELVSPRSSRSNRSDAAAIAESKETVRKELRAVLSEQFADPSLRAFISECEAPSAGKKTKSILSLIADGKELHDRLAGCAAGKKDGTDPLAQAVQPYLQLVPGEGEADIRDEFTGLKLGAIWRYFRYTWSIPQTTIPGRQMFYLVRDRNHPFHAVVGIAALSNSPLLSPSRDQFVGWTTDAFVERFLEASRNGDVTQLRGMHSHLLALVESALGEVDPTGLVDPSCFDAPSASVIERLQRRSNEFASQREQALRDRSDAERAGTVEMIQEFETQYGEPPVSLDVLNLEGKKAHEGTHETRARRLLVAKKRAFELARLLKAKAALTRFAPRLEDPASVPAALVTDELRGAMTTALVAVKSDRVGTNMLEITTCGAVAPYNHILGGKLVALLLLSPEVAGDYQRRYGGRPSIISSQLKNANRTKDCTLAWLNTTSLYALGSSQYERLRLPAGIISSDQKEIRYQRVGDTVGYGTVQFSEATVRAVEAAWQEKHNYSDVNSIFGEGFSPKFRKLRDGMDMLGFNPTVLMRHDQTRRVFAVPLWEGAARFLRGETTDLPDFLQEPGRFRDATGRIARFWRERWLASRIKHAPTMQTLREAKPQPVGTLVQSLAPEPGSPKQSRARRGTSSVVREDAPSLPDASAIPVVSVSSSSLPPSASLEFWRDLALAGPEACADEVSLENLDLFHIPLPLDEFLVARVREGSSLVLTGNAGDGKTHLLRRLAAEFAESGAVVEPDATAAMHPEDISPIMEAWKAAAAAGHPYCLAANEYPFHLLRQVGQDFAPVEEADRQARERLVYGSNACEEHPNAEKVLVVDLSLRNPLHPDFALRLLRRILEQLPIIAGVHAEPEADLAWNHRHLSNPQVQERLGKLLARCCAAGERATVREILIWFARLLFGAGRDDSRPTRSPGRWYASRLFEDDDRFAISLILKQWADPAAHSHPRWDWLLESGAVQSGWLVDGSPQLLGMDQNNFTALKRRFFFEHERGEEAFALDPTPGGELLSILSAGTEAGSPFKQHLIESINRAYCCDLFPEMSTRLYLWVGHRFHEQPSRSHVANQSIAETDLRLDMPRLPARLEGSFAYQPDHLVLSYHPPDHPPVCLRVDRPLVAALEKINSGLPRQLLPDRELNRLDFFLEELRGRGVSESTHFMLHCHDTRSTLAISLNQKLKEYVSVRQPQIA